MESPTVQTITAPQQPISMALLNRNPTEYAKQVEALLVPPTLKQFLDLATERGLTMEVDSAEAEASAAENMNNLAKGIGQVEAAVKEARKPLKEAADTISDKGRQAVELAQRALAEQTAKVGAFRKKAAAEREAAIQAEAKRQAEERAAREAAAAAAQRKAEEARLAAEAAQRQAERLKWEAEERERLAAAELMKGAPSTPQALKDASADLEAAAAEEARAARAQLEAQQAAEALAKSQAEAEEAARLAASAPTTAVEIIPAAPAEKVKGMKVQLVPTIHAVDLALLPLAYHSYDESKIKKHLVDGVQIPGVQFTMAEVVKATKR